MREFILITFESTNYAMQAESQLKNAGINFQVIPTPREITLSCGLSIRLPMEYIKTVQDIISSGQIKIKELYEVKNLKGHKSYNKLGR